MLRRLKFDNDTLHKVCKLVYYHDYRMPAEAANVRKAMNKIGEDLFPYYMEVRRADVLAQSSYQREEKLSNLDAIEKLYCEILEKKSMCVIERSCSDWQGFDRSWDEAWQGNWG